MARRQINRLIATQLNKLPAGMHPDGGNLWLQVHPKYGTRSWLFRYTLGGKSREMGLGALHTIGLADARARATKARQQILDGVDPIDHRKADKAARAQAAASVKTFRQCAEAYIAANKGAWRNPKHAAQWPASLEAYAYPVIGDLPVASVTVESVLQVVEPIWANKNETADRVRMRIEKTLSWAKVKGFRTGENPARWRGHLDQMLPARKAVSRTQHQPAMDYVDLPAFMATLRRKPGISARALEFLILTASRTTQAIDAPWSEFDLVAKLWTIPKERMKATRAHIVPLPDAAIAILEQMKGRDATYVFPGGKPDRPLSNMALAEMLKGINGDPPAYVDRLTGRAAVVHGFRSTFRDWAAEDTSYPREVAELALAHTNKDKVEAAYRRGDLLAKRAAMMADWANYCGSAPADREADSEAAAVAATRAIRKATGKTFNEAARLAIDTITAAHGDFHDVDLGSGPMPAPPTRRNDAQALTVAGRTPTEELRDLADRRKQHVVDEHTPPLQAETRLHPSDSVVRRVARDAEAFDA